LNKAECKAACHLHLIILNRRNIGAQVKKVGIGSARSIKSCIKPAVRQVVFTDGQITIRQRVAVLPVLGYWSELCSDIGQSFAPIGLHKTDAASDWLRIK
jgi:hypothetical protein